MNLSRLAGAVLFVLVPACDSAATQREDARRFLVVYEDLTDTVGVKARTDKLAALRELPLKTAASDAARDVCVEAQAALLDAEAQQEEAAVLLDKALAGAAGDALKPEQMVPIQEGIDRSDESLRDARETFSDCEDAVRDLAIRYAERR